MSILFFSGFSIMFCITFVFIIGVFIFVFARLITQWNKNNNSPRLTVDAEVISRRMQLSSHHRHSSTEYGMSHMSHSTYYYVTFQFESGDRLELNVSGEDYGLLCEGDRGKLSFQGTRYLGFERI